MGVMRGATIMAGCAIAVLGNTVSVAAAPALSASGPAARQQSCSAGARTLSHYGDHVYPETGNGGYRSVHTDVHMVYDAPSNQFLPGNHVDLTDDATQCLTELQPGLRAHLGRRRGRPGPDRAQRDGQRPAGELRFPCSRPTPATRTGMNDPDPRAHEASQHTPVGGPENNPLPPACSPELTADDPDAPGRRAVPGQQAGDHPVARRSSRATVRRARSPTPAGRACTSTATARPKAGSAPTRPR